MQSFTLSSATLACAMATGAVAGELHTPDTTVHEARAAMAKAGGSAGPEYLGRDVIWQDVMQTGAVFLSPDCSVVSLGPQDRCVTLSAAPAPTAFDERDIGSIVVPGKSAQSLLCQWVTPFLAWQFENPTAATTNASFFAVPYISIDNEVFNDPALLDPGTGLPLAGTYEIGLSASHLESRSLDPGQYQFQRLNYSRVCIGGIVNRPTLEFLGLSPSQINEFFKKPTTIRFHVRGSVQSVSDGFVFYGMRLVSD